MAAEIEINSLTEIEDIERAYALIQQHEEQLDRELDALLDGQQKLDTKMNSLQKVVPNLQVVLRDAEKLHQMIDHTAELAEKVSSKVRKLDLAKGRVQTAIDRTGDILDLKSCVDGVKEALKNEEYEQAAGHIHRYLTLDENTLRKTVEDSDDLEGSDLKNSFTLLHKAEEKIKKIITAKFDEAVRKSDRASIERFFKIFPLVGLHEVGLEKFARYINAQIATKSQKNQEKAREVQDTDRRASVVFAETITMLFEDVARIVEAHQPLVETYYGPGHIFPLLKKLQEECDRQAEAITNQFTNKRDFYAKIKSIRQMPSSKGSSGNLERIDPRTLDVLLGEIVLMNARTELYFRFLKKQVVADMEVLPDENKAEDMQKMLEKLITDSGLSRKMQEIIGSYIIMEEFYMRETVSKAIDVDTFEGDDDEAVTSSMVDDVFFIVQKSLRRAITSASVDGACAMMNHASTLLDTDYKGVFQQKIKQGFPSGSYDIAGVLQGKLQSGLSSSVDTASLRKGFLVTLNNLHATCENIQKLKRDLDVECAKLSTQAGGEHTSGKLESGLSDLSNTTTVFRDLLQLGCRQLADVAVIPRFKPQVEGFSSINHNLTEDEFAIYEVNDPFVQNLISTLESSLLAFKGPLASENYDSLVYIVTNEIAALLEKVILKSKFNRLGGLQFDKELRSLVGYLTAITQWTVRDRFARLTQMATILNMERVSEIMEYWDSSSGPLTWRLTPTEVRQIMTLRVDFRLEDINRLKL
ncbi:conserved oligomeric Golgi complex subunit 4-like [Dendronephthya gigantea]|uniref:conserved oligomeric Golgi complex subunit 4-like n=1 Tax=Dendronephthya gigantea TaxID=151771 RepID=UPI00106A2BEE|nr:conserved oligomeric Golgi complex subunit 4-like [Dendronephthya gigantea]